ncbi:MAG TPA: hypothetical protein VF867_09975 [Arthrobacter sp.]
MANTSKNKGDRFEREAVPVMVGLLPEFALAKAMRHLGAGRAEDIGDLYVLADAAIQVKAWKDSGAGIRAAASGSVVQAGHGDKEIALGMFPILGARAGHVRWLACVAPDRWPVPVEPVAEFAMVSKALKWVKTDQAPHGFRAWDRLERVGLLAGPGEPTLIAPIEAWAAAYRAAHTSGLRLAA